MTSALQLRLASVTLLVLLAMPGPGSERLTSQPRPKGPEAQALRVGEEVNSGGRRRLVLPDGSVVFVTVGTTFKVTGDRRLDLTRGDIMVEAAPGKEPFVVKSPRREVSGTGPTFALRAGDKGTAVLVTRGKLKVSDVEQPLQAGQQLAADETRARPAPRASHALGWMHDVLVETEAPLVPASDHRGGSLTAKDPDGQEARLSLRRYHVDVHIEDGFARTTIDQTYFNFTHGRLEGTFHFPLPADASLSRLAMYVDGQRMEGGMVERDRARNVYETIVSKQQDPALLEWIDGTTFKMRVFPLEPRQEKRIILSYTQKLTSLHGQESYRFPAGHSLGSVRDWSVSVRVKNGKGVSWTCPRHFLRESSEGSDCILHVVGKHARSELDRDFVLNLSTGVAPEPTRFSMMEHDGAKYLMVRHRPELNPRGAGARKPRDWVFLFESSGDRNPLLARTQVEIVRGLLQNADPDDTFAVVTAGTRTHSPMKERQAATPANVEKALGFLEGSHLIGALDMDRALTAAAALLKSGREPHLVHVGSGIAAMGEQKPGALLKRIPDDVRYIGVGVGRRWNRAFMQTAAEKSGGLFTQVNPDEPIAWRAFELASILNAPRMLGITVEDGARNRWLTFTNMLAQGEELCAITRIEKELPDTVTIRGRVDDRPVELILRVGGVKKNAGALPRTWARLEIDRLVAEGAEKHRPAIVELSKAMYVMSPFTSLLVLENEAMYEQYKVDRGRKDHWARYDCPEKIEVVFEDEDGNRIDPKKAVKPTPRQTLETILVRTPPEIVGPAAEKERAFPSSRSAAALGLDITKPGRADPSPESVEEMARIRNGPIIDGFAAPTGHNPRVDEWPINYGRGSRRGSLGGDIGIDLKRVKELDPAGQLVIMGDAARKPEVLLRQLREAENDREATRQELLSALSRTRSERKTSRMDAERNLIESFTELNEERKGRVLADVETRTDVRSSDLDRMLAELIDSHERFLLYHRPRFTGSDRLFYDLVSYAPGMNTTLADILAVLEAEAAPSIVGPLGHIDGRAREMFDRARKTGWRSFTMPASGGEAAFSIRFDGTGRFAWERTVYPGLREQVVCDGKTLRHLYPDLHIGATRTLSRQHRLAFWRLVPLALPAPEDLARGFDLNAVGENMVAVVPNGAGLWDAQGKLRPYVQLHLVFDEKGGLAEQHLAEMPADKLLARAVFGPDGSVRVLDAAGKEITARERAFVPAQAPSLEPDVSKLVVLPLPYRTREHIVQARKLEKTRYQDMDFDDARALFASLFASGSNNELERLFRESFHGREQRQLGLYVFLAAAGLNLDAQNLDVLAEHRDDPLAQYLALHSSPVLRKHASQWAVGSVPWGDGAFRHLALTHALLQVWQSPRVLDGGSKQRSAALASAAAYVEKHPDSEFGFALLSLMTERTEKAERDGKDAKDVRTALARLWPQQLQTTGLETAARYEHARALVKAGRAGEGRKAFVDLYRAVRKEGALLLLDDDFRQALLGVERDGWNVLMRTTARELIDKKQRGAVLALARQCGELNDEPLGQDLLAMMLDGVADHKERLALTLASADYLLERRQAVEAARLLEPLLEDGEGMKQPAVWRLSARLAGARGLPGREMECLERALDLESHDPSTLRRTDRVQGEYLQLLDHYRKLAEAMVTLKVKPPADFVPKVVRTADRWRGLARDGSRACEMASRILRQLGEAELAWDYLTTTVAERPGESRPWLRLAEELRRQGELKQADLALASAFAVEPTNAQILWDRAQNLRQAGNVAEANKLLRQLAEGTWQPRFQALQLQARWQLDRR